jgi:hypothetical protein
MILECSKYVEVYSGVATLVLNVLLNLSECSMSDDTIDYQVIGGNFEQLVGLLVHCYSEMLIALSKSIMGFYSLIDRG